MQMRLAFSVAAHLEPEILIIDEVLAVGDAEFQKKCLGKMQDVARGGRTVLFVSHNMAAIENLCSNAIALSKGKVVHIGPTKDVVATYLASTMGSCYQPMHRSAGMKQIVQDINIQELDAESAAAIRCGSDVRIDVRFQSPVPLPQARIGLRIDSLSGTPLAHLQSEISTGSLIDLPASGVASCTIRRLPLLPGRYSLVLAVFSKGALIDHLNPAIEFDVEHGDFYGTGRLPQNSTASFLLQSEWCTSPPKESIRCN
jgi:lipopolysaccharide transport system ATP-binding protein